MEGVLASQRGHGRSAGPSVAHVRPLAAQSGPHILSYRQRHAEPPEVAPVCAAVETPPYSSRMSPQCLGSNASPHSNKSVARRRLRTMGSELACFKGGDGSHDWDYPFDLCGSIYRSSLVASILEEIEKTCGLAGLGHPNTLEVQGNQALARLQAAGKAARALLRGCLQRRAMVVVTINRVQSVCSNRVYRTAPPAPPGAASPDGREARSHVACEVEELDRLLFERAELDEASYLAHALDFSCVHVGGLRIKSRSSHVAPPLSSDSPCVSVVLPVYNCARFLPSALRSLQVNPKP